MKKKIRRINLIRKKQVVLKVKKVNLGKIKIKKKKI